MRKRGGSLLVVLLLIGYVVGSSYAQQDNTYTGLDILFLIDQSGSMGGADYDYPDRAATDPLGLRFEAVQYALDTLGEYRLLIAPNLAIRMAVINFGDAPDIALNWTPIAASADNWPAERQRLLSQLSADTFRATHNPKNLGNTNFMAALEEAQQLFDTLPPAAPNENHLRVIVLLTDGEPCAATGVYQFNCLNPEAKKEHMQLVEDLVAQVFPSSDYQIYVLALDASGALWDKYREAWEAVVGDPTHATRVETAPEISARFLEILNQLVAQTSGDTTTAIAPPQKLAPGTNTIFVPPYQRQMRLSIFKASTDPANIVITRPDGTALQAGDPQLTISNSDRPIEIWTIAYPCAGNWQITISSQYDKLTAYLEMIPLEVAVETQTRTVLVQEPLTFAVSLLDASTQLPLSDPSGNFPLSVTATLHLPQGADETLALSEVQQGRYEGTYTPSVAGTYTVSVQAHTTLPDGTDLTLVDAPNVGTFVVDGLSLQVEGFPNSDLLVGDVVQLSAQVMDSNGQLVELDTQRLTATLEENQQPVQNVLMAADPTGTALYTAEFPLLEQGQYVIRVVLENASGVVLDEAVSRPFRTLPSDTIRVVLVRPAGDYTQYATTGVPPIKPNTLEIVFETRLSADNSLVDVQALRDDPTAPVLQVKILQEGRPPQNVRFETTDTAGRYRASVTGLEAGTYTVQVTGSGALQARYIFDPHESVARARVVVETNPYLYVFWGGLALAGVLGMSALMLTAVRNVRRRKHAAQGQLAILVTDLATHSERELWRVDLSAYHSNHIRISKRALPGEVPITSLVVTCDDDSMAARRAVRVTAMQGKRVILKNRLLSPGQSVSLQRTSLDSLWDEQGNEGNAENTFYTLVKDPDPYADGDTDLGSNLF